LFLTSDVTPMTSNSASIDFSWSRRISKSSKLNYSR
jgi:hypothetical protein